MRQRTYVGVRAGVVVNKWDLNPAQAEKLEDAARRMGAAVLGRVGFDRSFAEALAGGQAILEYAPGSAAARELGSVWGRIEEAVA